MSVLSRLLVSRKAGEGVVIRTPHGDVRLVVFGVLKNGRATFGIESPTNVPVRRGEAELVPHPRPQEGSGAIRWSG